MEIFQKFNSLSKGASLPPEMVKRISSGVLIVACVLLVGWSFMFRLSLITEAQSKMHTPFSLGRQVASLEQMWSEEEAVVLQHEWNTVKSRSFGNYDQFMMWVTQRTAQAQALGLDVNFRIDDTSIPVPGIPEVHRLGMEVIIQSSSSLEGYSQFMQFIKTLSEDELTVNFDAIELGGSGNGAQKLELQLHTFLQQVI